MRRYPRDKPPVPPPVSLRSRTPTLEEKISEHAARTRDTSNAENHLHIVAWHKRVLRDYNHWLEKNGKKDPT